MLDFSYFSAGITAEQRKKYEEQRRQYADARQQLSEQLLKLKDQREALKDNGGKHEDPMMKDNARLQVLANCMSCTYVSSQ